MADWRESWITAGTADRNPDSMISSWGMLNASHPGPQSPHTGRRQDNCSSVLTSWGCCEVAKSGKRHKFVNQCLAQGKFTDVLPAAVVWRRQPSGGAEGPQLTPSGAPRAGLGVGRAPAGVVPRVTVRGDAALPTTHWLPTMCRPAQSVPPPQGSCSAQPHTAEAAPSKLISCSLASTNSDRCLAK